MDKKPDWGKFWLRSPLTRSKTYFKLYTRFRLRAYLRLLKNLDLSGKTTLELGGGSGYLSKLLSKKKGTKPLVVDNNREAYEFCRKINSEIEYFCQDMFKHRGKYDLVFSDGLVEHFYPGKEREGVIALHKKLLKKGGQCIIFVPKKSWLVRKFMSMKNEYEEKFTLEQLKKEAKSAGLRILAGTSDLHMVGILCK